MYVLILPTYNNASTIERVIDEAKEHISSIIVVNDGSTDSTHSLLSKRTDITLVEYPDGKNRGKGFAIQTGLRKAGEMGFRYAITMDSDGQHFASDIPEFIKANEAEPGRLIVGARNLKADGMPGKNTFANRFSNFWFWAETLQHLSDTQSGFRLYPLESMKDVRFFSPRYEFEVEVLVRMAWREVKVVNIPINVIYPPDRVSHFRPLRDFARISVLNTCLFTIALLWFYPLHFCRYLARTVRDAATDSPSRTAAAIGVGTAMCIMPCWGFQTVVAIALAAIFRLNKVVTVAFATLSLPPVIPFIIWGSLATGGLLLGTGTDISISGLTPEIALGYATQYFLGAVVFAIITGLAAFGIARIALGIRK